MREVSEAEARRRYLQGELDRVTPSPYDNIIRVKFFGEEDSKHLNITPEQYAAIKKIIVPEPESPVSYDPCITGTIDIEGRKSEFMLLLDRADVGYSQWGADNTVLWPRTDLLEGMSASAKEWWLDNKPEEDDTDG